MTTTQELVIILNVPSAMVYGPNNRIDYYPIKGHITLAYLGYKTIQETYNIIKELTEYIEEYRDVIPEHAIVNGRDNFGKNHDIPVFTCYFENDKSLLRIWSHFNTEQEQTKGFKLPNFHVSIKKDHPEMKVNDKYTTGTIALKQVGGDVLLEWVL